MSIQRRLLGYLLVSAPLVWGVALAVSVQRARVEVNEFFDAEMIRLAHEVQANLAPLRAREPAAPATGPGERAGEADAKDLAIFAWDAEGRLLAGGLEGVQLPRRPGASGFVAETIDGAAWRIYYLPATAGGYPVAVGQRAYERDELSSGLANGQALPWLLMLPVLLAVMVWAVRRALAPVRRLAAELQSRAGDDLRPVPPEWAPAELRSLVRAGNGMLDRIEQLLARERRFTADAAHELRTPLAVLRAEWDVVRRARDADERAHAEASLCRGLERMDRLVAQMLALARVETQGAAPLATQAEVRWAPVVEQVMSDCLPLALRRQIELVCEWPDEGRHPLPLVGDEELLVVMLRNLLDNAARYAPCGSTVTLGFSEDEVAVENGGPPLDDERLARLGERFYRPHGQHESGCGLGVSIVRRIAALHRLVVCFGAGAGGAGVRVVLRFDR